MSAHFQNLIVGQGLAGSALAWTLHKVGQTVQIVDQGEPNTASRVAAGLLTPVTGKRLVKSDTFDEDWSAALAFYRWVEQETATSLFTEGEMIRLFEHEEYRSDFLNRSDPSACAGIESWAGTLQQNGREQSGIRMSPAGRLNVKRYMEATKKYFEARDGYVQQKLEVSSLKFVEEAQIAVESLSATFDRLILCSGARVSELFPNVPNNPSRGDILNIKIPGYQRNEVVHRSVWIAPNEDGTQTVGSTYDWKSLTPEPREAGKMEVLGKLSRMIEGAVEVVSHRAGVRPTMKDYEPVIGVHPEHSKVFIFNGLGSKGTLRAPRLAVELLDLMDGQGPPLPNHSYDRLRKSSAGECRQRPLTTLAQDVVRETLKAGDRAIDATVGNGFDTCFLSKTVGEAGLVTGFDVQQTALEATRRRLQAEGLTNVEVKHQGHETLATEVRPESVTAVMFNLGFLPRHDHAVITKPDTSTRAITAAIEVLKVGGVMTVLAYRGHAGGQEEFDAVERLLLTDSEAYDLERIDSVPEKSTSPVLFIVRKRRSDNDG